ncbi:hypothetical protein LTR37_003002 [Vermiconidia calcicola]|uniref:Uncharacterized protein n=1 Tax=Vermiconidia calcicola TaxID=1690605 RepID=A0ACC3NSM5_9PEZI|nr:hypothetical protein LTR37_003002 [Vermiconidia calcicola]
MPSAILHPPCANRLSGDTANTLLPQTLRTPSGLAILEIQGTINTPSNAASGQQQAHPIGKIVLPPNDPAKPVDKRVYMYVGKHQRLTGELKKLTNPIAIIQRRKDGVGGAEESDELEIAEIVHYKILFAHRPEPVGGGGDE